MTSIRFLTNPVDLPHLQMDTEECSGSTETVLKDRRNVSKSRHQRRGPSCDNCRSRKIRCNADIQILDWDQLTKNEQHVFLTGNSTRSSLSESVVGFDYRQNPIFDLGHGWKLVQTTLDNSKQEANTVKFIKFQRCENCSRKSWHCLFSKGFTRIHSVKLED